MFYDTIKETAVNLPGNSKEVWVHGPNESLLYNTNTTWHNKGDVVTNTSSVKTEGGGFWWASTPTTTTTTNTRRVINTTEAMSSSTTLSRDVNVKTSIIPFMRARTIVFTATGLKPNSVLDAYFAGELVTVLCTSMAPDAIPGKLVASGNGSIIGTFSLPGNSFKTGTRKFVLQDSTDKHVSNASTEYTASGEDIKIHTTDTINTVTTIQKTITDTTTNNVSVVNRRAPVDPVAQSFFVDTAETSQGVYIHSIDLFFFDVDRAHSVLLEIRRMENGYPTLDLMTPYSFARVNGSDIKVSNNGTAATRFTFETPIFLAGNDEYAFVALCNSDKTAIWCSELGHRAFKPSDGLVATGEIISKQPYLGTMFTSQNNSTWNAVQTRDVKFVINRCKFSTNSGSINFAAAAKANTNNNPNIKFMAKNSLEFTKSSKEVKLYAHGHSLIEGDVFRLYMAVGQLQTMFGVNKNMITNTPLTVTGVSATHIKFNIPVAANGSGSSGGDLIIMDGWVAGFSQVELLKQDITLDNTSVSYKLNAKLQRNYSAAASGNYTLIPNKLTELNDTYVVKSSKDMGAVISTTLQSSNSMLSPMIYTDNIGLNGHVNVINNIDYKNALGAKVEDSSPAKYIQKEVSLLNPANELKVYFESNIPYGASVSVYYKTGNNAIDETTDWTKMDPDKGSTMNSDNGLWRTQKYTKSFTTEWDVFQVMIVMNSSSKLIVPKIKNYRAIALNA